MTKLNKKTRNVLITLTEQNTPEWFAERRTHPFTGSRAKKLQKTNVAKKDDIIAALMTPDTDRKELNKLTVPVLTSMLSKEQHNMLLRANLPDEYYKVLADKLAIPPEDGEDARERGHTFEDEAANAAAKELKLNLAKVGMVVRADNDYIAISPDRIVIPKNDTIEMFVDSGDVIKKAVEIKCLGSDRHIKAVLTNKIPEDFMDQVVQYFVVMDDLEELYFVFYDPRFEYKPLHIIKVTRDEVQDSVIKQREYQEQLSELVDEDILLLTF